MFEILNLGNVSEIGEVQLFVEKYHPDTILANRAVRIFSDNGMM